MGFRYEQHSDLCGCDRCARQWETESPRPVFDRIEDSSIRDCGCHIFDPCRCDDYDPNDDDSDCVDLANAVRIEASHG